jgi:hypothetical protein
MEILKRGQTPFFAVSIDFGRKTGCDPFLDVLSQAAACGNLPGGPIGQRAALEINLDISAP